MIPYNTATALPARMVFNIFWVLIAPVLLTIIKNKNANSAFEIRGVSFKKELDTIKTEKIEVELLEEVKTKTTQERKKVIRKTN